MEKMRISRKIEEPEGWVEVDLFHGDTEIYLECFDTSSDDEKPESGLVVLSPERAMELALTLFAAAKGAVDNAQ